MRIEVVDPGMHGVGLALGLVEAGHDVRYMRGDSSGAITGNTAGASGSLARMQYELIDRFLGGGVALHDAPTKPNDVDLVVIVDVFADYLLCLHERCEPSGGGAGLYPARLQCYADRALAAPRVAVVDMSDSREHREILFERVPGAVLFAREVAQHEPGSWCAFPFLYNAATLWLERCAARDEWWRAAPRAARWDWVFLGTIAHGRYGDRRAQALDRLRAQRPELRSLVATDRSFLEVLDTMQSARFVLDLPGAGDICFRMHESLSVGVPLWRPGPVSAALPAGLDAVVVSDPSAAVVHDPDEVRKIYERCYAPRAAAELLLREVFASSAPAQV